jgi:hypothetical protein
MIRVISSPSSSTRGFATLIFAIAVTSRASAGYCSGATIKTVASVSKPTGEPPEIRRERAGTLGRPSRTRIMNSPGPLLRKGTQAGQNDAFVTTCLLAVYKLQSSVWLQLFIFNVLDNNAYYIGKDCVCLGGSPSGPIESGLFHKLVHRVRG